MCADPVPGLVSPVNRSGGDSVSPVNWRGGDSVSPKSVAATCPAGTVEDESGASFAWHVVAVPQCVNS